MSVGSNIVRGRSHFIFIAALLSAGAFIMWTESHDPDSWGQRRLKEFEAGSQPRIVASYPSEAAARRECQSIRSKGGSCQLILPSPK